MHVKVVWISMMAMADAEGCVMASVPGLADAARVSLEQCQEALLVLGSPDPWSRTKALEGRRIVEVDGGWKLVNYKKYRELGRHEVASLATKGYVYYAHLPGRIKIGFSKNPWARMSDLRVTAPSVVLLGVEAGSLDVERDRHDQFKAHRIEGEWFTASSELMDFIERLPNVSNSQEATVATVAKSRTTKEAEAEAEAEKIKSVTPAAPLIPNPHAKATNLVNGPLQRKHGEHAFCGRVCVHYSQHDEFIGRLGSPDAHQRLLAWYPTVLARYEGQAVTDDMFRFWANSVSAWMKPVTSKPSQRPEASDKATRAMSAYEEVIARQQSAQKVLGS